MSLKGIVLFALLAVAVAERPYLGLSVPSLEEILPYVVGGKEAPKGSFPYIVSLQWGRERSKTMHFCAGSILNKEWIVTAAHCIRAVPPFGTFFIRAGKHYIKENEPTEQKVDVLETFVHEQYKGGIAPYDIALIKLKTPLTFTKEVQPIELPIEGSEPVGDATLCGWGSVSRTKQPIAPYTLQYVDMVFVDRETCRKAILYLTGSAPVHATNVCTGPLEGEVSACSGDSGGPLIKRYENKPVLTGIVSWGILPCGTYGAPSVYTKVSAFTPWIQKNIKAHQY